MTIDELLRLLGSDDPQKRGEALYWAYQQGGEAAPDLITVLRHRQANLVARVWAMMGLALMGAAAIPVARDALTAALADPSPTIRRRAIETLAALGDGAARGAIARLLRDDTLDPSAWFDDDGTVAQAARRAMVALAPEAAPDDSQLVDVFISTGRFTSFEQMRAYIDPTYTDDGDEVPSAFMQDVGLRGYAPMCIEAIPSETGAPVPVARLVAGGSWADLWLPALDATRTADAAICVFWPNSVAHPERCSVEHLGVVYFRVPPEAVPGL